MSSPTIGTYGLTVMSSPTRLLSGSHYWSVSARPRPGVPVCSYRRRHLRQGVDDPVHGVATARVGQVRQQLENESHQGRMRHPVLGRDAHDLRVPDQLDEDPADSVVAAEAFLE